MIPIVESLSDAPEQGDAILQLTPAYDPDVKPTWCIPVRDQLPAWKIRSVAGWKTTAEIPPALRFEIPGDGEGRFNPDPILWNLPGIVFAPTAEAAIERYHASEACPFGKVQLVRYEYRDAGIRFRFENATHGWHIQFTETWVSFPSNGIGAYRGNDQEGLIAFHALLGEIIAYQTAERSGTCDSRIHRELAEGKI